MVPYKRLLAIVATGHDDCAALAHASALAARCEAELLLLSFDKDAPATGDSQSNFSNWIDQIVQGLIDQGICASGRHLDGKPQNEAMLAEIRLHDPDIVIKELRRESALHRLFFTPDDFFLARHSSRPLMVVGEGSSALPRRVIAAVDVMATGVAENLNSRIIIEAARIASVCGADLHLAHVFEPVIDAPEGAALQITGSSPTLSLNIQEAHEQRFAELADLHNIPQTNRHFGFGRVGLALEDISRSIDAELIVTGSHDRRGLERFVMGSTSEELLMHSRHSVMVVKPLLTE